MSKIEGLIMFTGICFLGFLLFLGYERGVSRQELEYKCFEKTQNAICFKR
jgi:hypothetical protein